MCLLIIQIHNETLLSHLNKKRLSFQINNTHAHLFPLQERIEENARFYECSFLLFIPQKDFIFDDSFTIRFEKRKRFSLKSSIKLNDFIVERIFSNVK